MLHLMNDIRFQILIIRVVFGISLQFLISTYTVKILC